ncbi:MAG: 4Fe-4S dicluster domain-containing protein [Planctomycetota bacterium]|nr:4Fe-4S dicluster domain-containing protein [Planctomycetota bacterium]
MKLLDASKLDELAKTLAGAGYRVVVPAEDGEVVRYAEWSPEATIRTDAFPVNSAKDFLLPRSEVIDRYELHGDDFVPKEVRPEAPKTVLLAVRPCDAQALAMLDTIFNWDYEDELYNARRQATTVVPMVCTEADAQCFCTSVGGAPDSTAGADAMLRPADGGTRFILEPLTEKGEALAEAAATALADGEAQADPPAEVPARFDPEQVRAWLDENFESDLWDLLSLACLGCGACAYACPTCHCFDIQDESTRTEAVRLRNWDSCGFGLFTQHAGGHNPRPDQAARWRNRVMHKFSYIPERFSLLGCTGCGRCARVCPAGMAMLDACVRIEEESKKAPAHES